MNSIIQNSIVFISLALSVAFLIKKYWFKKKSKKACGGDDGCGCH